MKYIMNKTAMLLALAMVAISAPHALASSGDAWGEWRRDVDTACRAAMGLSAVDRLEVTTFGSESYGFAIGYNSAGPIICVYDKQTQKVEISDEFTRLPTE